MVTGPEGTLIGPEGILTGSEGTQQVTGPEGSQHGNWS